MSTEKFITELIIELKNIKKEFPIVDDIKQFWPYLLLLLLIPVIYLTLNHSTSFEMGPVPMHSPHVQSNPYGSMLHP